ncbi:sigma-70 family RNA polymerase sigma factor [Kitasatospora sp. RG8]|uniref:sigma-70 family RNA polymerase sigma factor n=1 Tax=Kitasatospora sp. RG8 TaxID=2820815 RepID=UPI001ADF48E2|nr:sigma-70 family RNA polymerase sigma factor [Kitasatospora sp. RG8]MBP0450731.1 sigma-70 family RNA polymerase sigma factor [Kitasatospora sp. RG8]
MTPQTQAHDDTCSTGRPRPGAENLRSLLTLSARGDEAAYERLYHAVAGPVYGVALRTLRNPAHAEEVAQEVLLEVWRTAAAYRPERGSVMTWVLTIAHHRAVDRVRAATAAAERDQRVAFREPAESDPLDDQVVRSLDRARVRAALAGLSRVQREAVVLAYYGGYSQREIAHLVSVPLGTVKTRIRDGLTRLRAAFAFASDRPGTRDEPTALRPGRRAGAGGER